MRFKIISLEDTEECPEVLLQAIYTDDSQYMVEISAWHYVKTDEFGDSNYYQIEQLEFPDLEMAESFINDYSKASAIKFTESYTY